MIRRIGRRGRAVLRTAAFGSYTAVMVGVSGAHERAVHEQVRLRVADRYVRRYCRDMMRLFGVDASILGGHPGPSESAHGRLIVSNHRTVVDMGIILGQFGGHALSRGDVQDWPLLGPAARRARTIFVDRDDKHSGASAIRAIRRKLQAGHTVLVFPEGGTFAGDEVRPFQGGAFAATRGLDVEIVPVGLAYPHGVEFADISFMEHLSDMARRRRTPVVAHLGRPFRAKGRAKEIANHAQGAVEELVDRARADFRRIHVK